MMVNLELYHTCRFEGDEAEILKSAPFKARNNRQQWLGVGYYFWVESLRFAELWERQSPAYKEHGYLVIRYTAEIERDDLLDLVGSPKDQEGFLELLSVMAKELGNRGGNLTVSACVEWLRSKERFEWLAVKLADYGKSDRLTEQATPVIRENGELTFLKPRVQLCLYAEPSDSKIEFFCTGVVGRGGRYSGKKKQSLFKSYK